MATMKGRDEEFRVRTGRVRNRGGGKSFVSQVLRAAQRAGHGAAYSPGGQRSSRPGRSTFGRGRTAFARHRLFAGHRRVVVKARVVRHHGRAFRSAPLSAHIAYLKRDGVTREGEPAHMYDAQSDRADSRAFAERSKDDRHHFRFIISPEDATTMVDLKAFTRDLAGQMEHDLGTKLDWVAVDHWNTDNPHVHMLVRGVAADGSDLVISRDYISRGLRSRAEELVSVELGPKPEHEIRMAMEREVDAERWTGLDAVIRSVADETGFIDLRTGHSGAPDLDYRRLAIGRLQRLERLGLATDAGPGRWVFSPDAERRLRDLGMRGDIIKTMHRAFTERGRDRGISDYAIETDAASSPIIGRLVGKGLHDELTGEAYAVIDGTDGRAHHVRFRGVEAFAHAPPVGGIVEVRRFGSADDPRPTLVLANRSDIDLAPQVTAPGATWLDHRLVERESMALARAGFGQEVRDAMAARAEHLVATGLARRQGQTIVMQRDLLATLRRSELDSVGAALSAETGLPYHQVASGHVVSGTYRQRLTLSSGRFAMIDDGLSFQLVPWSPSLENHIGRDVSGIARDGGGIDWSFTRQRGLGL
jgi:type IV secretory pathway VirD2 relaxase